MTINRVYSSVKGYQGQINNFDDLVHYIAGTPPVENLTITDEFDNLIISTIGNFLDRVTDKDLLCKLQSELIPLQLGEKKIRIFELSKE